MHWGTNPVGETVRSSRAWPSQNTSQRGASQGTSPNIAELRNQLVATLFRPIPMTTEPTKPKPRRPFWQFSLRTMLVLLTVFCMWLGWIAHRANEQRKAVAWVRETGGLVYYDYEIDEDGMYRRDPKPPGPKWLRQFLGADYFQEVTRLFLDNTEVSDLTPLAGMRNLEVLHLDGTQVSDLAPLAKLTSLQRLSLSNTQIREEQVEQLRKALPNCLVKWSPRSSDPSP